MKIKKLGSLGAALVAGAFGMSGMALAAESAAGVLAHAQAALKTAKEVAEHAGAGHKDQTIDALKELRSHTKELTGDPIGKNIQRANGRIREAITAAEAGKLSETAGKMDEALKELQTIEAYAAKSAKNK